MEGGKRVTRAVDLETLPLYVKAGTILPLGPVKQYVQQQSGEPLTLRIYPGADGASELYEDDGFSFGYQQGAFTRIACSWDDKRRTFALKADPRGELPKGKVFSVEVVGRPGARRIVMVKAELSVRL